jgi:hypothetical protein
MDSPPQAGEAGLAILIVLISYVCLLGMPLFLAFGQKYFQATIGLGLSRFPTWASIALSILGWAIASFILIGFSGTMKYAIFRKMKDESEHPVVGKSARATQYYKRRFGDAISNIATELSWVIAFLLFAVAAYFRLDLGIFRSPWIFVLTALVVSILLTALLSFLAFRK